MVDYPDLLLKKSPDDSPEQRKKANDILTSQGYKTLIAK